MARELSPEDIFLTQPVRNLFFSDGRSLAMTVEALRTNGRMTLPVMKFVEFDSKI